MKYITKSVLILAVSALMSFNSYAGDYSRHSGLTISLGNHHNGLSLSYKAPIKHHYKQKQHAYGHNSYKAKHYYQNNYRYAKKQYKNKHGYFAKKHYKKHASPNYRSYNKPNPYRQGYSNHYYQPKKRLHTQHQRKSAYNNNHYRQYQKSCHPVSKTVTDRHGRYQDIGGTMCYDRAGRGYVVSGSRYHIR
jgi:hypothetical protein